MSWQSNRKKLYMDIHEWHSWGKFRYALPRICVHPSPQKKDENGVVKVARTNHHMRTYIFTCSVWCFLVIILPMVMSVFLLAPSLSPPFHSPIHGNGVFTSFHYPILAKKYHQIVHVKKSPIHIQIYIYFKKSSLDSMKKEKNYQNHSYFFKIKNYSHWWPRFY